jgi:hypothetical protein
MDITQDEINKLLEIEKIEKDNKDLVITCIRKQIFELKATENNKIRFILNVFFSGNIKGKYTLNLNYPLYGINLCRIDINGREHRNPNYTTGNLLLDEYKGAIISENHIHIANIGDKKVENWAIPLSRIFDTKDIEEIKKVVSFFKKEINLKNNIVFYKKNKVEKYEDQNLF